MRKMARNLSAHIFGNIETHSAHVTPRCGLDSCDAPSHNIPSISAYEQIDQPAEDIKKQSASNEIINGIFPLQ